MSSWTTSRGRRSQLCSMPAFSSAPSPGLWVVKRRQFTPSKEAHREDDDNLQCKESTIERGEQLVTWLKHHQATVQIFLDKKVTTIDQARNSRNSGFLAATSSALPPSHHGKHPMLACASEWWPPMAVPCSLRGLRMEVWGLTST